MEVKVEVTLKEMLEDDDWAEVFGEGSYTQNDVESLDGTCEDYVFRADILSVIASVEGQNDGDEWLCVVLLKDGRYCAASGWCDYTGSDCQSGNTITVASSLENVIRMGLRPEQAARLGFEHPGKQGD